VKIKRKIRFWDVTVRMEDKELERIKAEKMKEMMSQQNQGVVDLNYSSFDNFLKTNLPVVVDLWADWCMPCRIMAPVMEELAKDYAGKALFARVDVDRNSEIANRYRIMSIPHFLIFKNGILVEKIVGAVGRGPLENALKKHL
jgi:thioredoxin 1